jgi:hypothetical protein
MTRFFVRRFMLSLISQYTLYTRLWFQGRPSLRMRVKHFQKPQRARAATIAFNASTTGASLAAQSVLGLYNADRDKPTNLQALLRES